MSQLDTASQLPPHEWRQEAERARQEGFTYLDWLTAVDQTDAQPGGFDVVVRILDIRTRGQWRSQVLRTRVADGADLASLTPVYPGAAWHEREVCDMFGIRFTGFDDGTGQGLRRLLLHESSPQAPLRKSRFLAARAARPWPGATDPAGSTGRRHAQPLGIPPAAEETSSPSADGADPEGQPAPPGGADVVRRLATRTRKAADEC